MKTKERQRRGKLDGLRERKEEERKRSGGGDWPSSVLFSLGGMSFLPRDFWQQLSLGL